MRNEQPLSQLIQHKLHIKPIKHLGSPSTDATDDVSIQNNLKSPLSDFLPTPLVSRVISIRGRNPKYSVSPYHTRSIINSNSNQLPTGSGNE